MSLLMGQFMDGQAKHESGNNYAYFAAGPDGTVGTSDDLLGRFSIRRYNWVKWCTQFFGAERDWKVPQNQDMVVTHLFDGRYAKYRIAFPTETLVQTWQRVAAWWKLPAYAGVADPTTWPSGLKSYVRKAGEAITSLGFEGWTIGEGFL